MGHAEGLADAPWPVADESALVSATIELPVQINGKVRARVTVPADAPEETVLAVALGDERVQAQVAGRPLRKRVVVPGRMVSLVV